MKKLFTVKAKRTLWIRTEIGAETLEEAREIADKQLCMGELNDFVVNEKVELTSVKQ